MLYTHASVIPPNANQIRVCNFIGHEQRFLVKCLHYLALANSVTYCLLHWLQYNELLPVGIFGTRDLSTQVVLKNGPSPSASPRVTNCFPDPSYMLTSNNPDNQ